MFAGLEVRSSESPREKEGSSSPNEEPKSTPIPIPLPAVASETVSSPPLSGGLFSGLNTKLLTPSSSPSSASASPASASASSSTGSIPSLFSGLHTKDPLSHELAPASTTTPASPPPPPPPTPASLVPTVPAVPLVPASSEQPAEPPKISLFQGLSTKALVPQDPPSAPLSPPTALPAELPPAPLPAPLPVALPAAPPATAPLPLSLPISPEIPPAPALVSPPSAGATLQPTSPLPVAVLPAPVPPPAIQLDPTPLLAPVDATATAPLPLPTSPLPLPVALPPSPLPSPIQAAPIQQADLVTLPAEAPAARPKRPKNRRAIRPGYMNPDLNPNKQAHPTETPSKASSGSATFNPTPDSVAVSVSPSDISNVPSSSSTTTSTTTSPSTSPSPSTSSNVSSQSPQSNANVSTDTSPPSTITTPLSPTGSDHHASIREINSPDVPEIEPFPLEIVRRIPDQLPPSPTPHSTPASSSENPSITSASSVGPTDSQPATPAQPPHPTPTADPSTPTTGSRIAVSLPATPPASPQATSESSSARKQARLRRKRETASPRTPNGTSASANLFQEQPSKGPGGGQPKQEPPVVTAYVLPDQSSILRLSATPIPDNRMGHEFKSKFEASLKTSCALVEQRHTVLTAIDRSLEQLRNLEVQQSTAAEAEDFEEAFNIAQVIEDLNGDLIQYQLQLVTLGERWIDVLNERKSITQSVITADREFIQCMIELHSGLTAHKSSIEQQIEEYYGKEFNRMGIEESDIKQSTESAVVDLGVLEENEKLTRSALTKQAEELDSNFRELSKERDVLVAQVEELRAQLREKEQALLARETAIRNIVVQTAELNKKFAPDFDRLATSRRQAQTLLLDLDRRHKLLAEAKTSMTQQKDGLLQNFEPVTHHLKKIETIQHSVELEKTNLRQLFKCLIHADHVRREIISHQTVHHSESFRLTTLLSQTNEAIRNMSGQVLRINEQVSQLSKTCVSLQQEIPSLVEQKNVAAVSRNFKEAARIAKHIRDQEDALAIYSDDLAKHQKHLQHIQHDLADRRDYREKLQSLMQTKEIEEKKATLSLLHKLKVATNQVIEVAIERDLYLQAEHLQTEVEAIDVEIKDICTKFSLPSPEATIPPIMEHSMMEQSDLSFIIPDPTSPPHSQEELVEELSEESSEDNESLDDEPFETEI